MDTAIYRRVVCSATVLLLFLACSKARDPVSFTDAPSVSPPARATAYFDRDVQRVFSRSCVGGCHDSGGIGDRNTGLILTPELAYRELLDPTASKNGPHVIPGDPTNSFLVWKLEDVDPSGRPVFGDPMPLDRPSLADTEIQAIRAWIQEGALRTDAPPVPPTVTEAAVLDSISLEVTFSEAMDTTSVENAANYRILEDTVAVLQAQLMASDRVRLETSPLEAGVAYTLVVRAVKDLSGDPLRSGEEGDRATVRFTPEISFRTQLQPILDARCAFVGCHAASSQFPPGENLVLESGSARENLVDRPSGELGSLNRVAPGDPESSYLIHKLDGRTSILGGRMPQGGPYLSEAQIGRFRLWIEQGAGNN